MYQRIVVPLDGSDIAETALTDAHELATVLDAPIHVVRVVDFVEWEMYVVDGRVADSSDPSTLLADEADDVRQYLAAVATDLAQHGCWVTYELRSGYVVDELIAAAHPGDLYVMASHGRSGLKRWFLGSVAEDVVRRSRVPVLLVRSDPSADPWFAGRAPTHRGITGFSCLAIAGQPSRSRTCLSWRRAPRDLLVAAR
jgi:nucleotide-binding universal stress UspA family protein